MKKFFSFLSQDIAIDLGTANTLIYVKGKGIVLNGLEATNIDQKVDLDYLKLRLR